MNKRIKKHIIVPNCTIVAGDRGVGKSTLFALAAEQFIKLGYNVYCQYPYDGVYQVPFVEVCINGANKKMIDKTWLYTANLSHSVVMIDEARTVWPARSYSKWTESDDEFFNFLRKNDTILLLATQSYDGVDLNVKRASDETAYLTRGFWHFTHIEFSRTTIAKVADRNTEVIGRMFRKGMQRVQWEICEIPTLNALFWRRPYYNKFFTDFTFDEKPDIPVPMWNDLIDFEQIKKSNKKNIKNSSLK